MVGLTGIVLWLLGLFVLYWVIRLAVRHSIADARADRGKRGLERA